MAAPVALERAVEIGVTDEGDPRTRRRAVDVRQVELPEQLAEDWMKWVQTVLYASSDGRRSISATRAPRCAYSRAAVQPAMLAPTTATS